MMCHAAVVRSRMVLRTAEPRHVVVDDALNAGILCRQSPAITAEFGFASQGQTPIAAHLEELA